MIEKNDVQKVAKLMHLTIPDECLDRFMSQINTVLDYMDHLDNMSVHLPKEAELNDSLNAIPTLREDTVASFEEIPFVLKNAPQTRDHCFLVPKVIASP